MTYAFLRSYQYLSSFSACEYIRRRDSKGEYRPVVPHPVRKGGDSSGLGWGSPVALRIRRPIVLRRLCRRHQSAGDCRAAWTQLHIVACCPNAMLNPREGAMTAIHSGPWLSVSVRRLVMWGVFHLTIFHTHTQPSSYPLMSKFILEILPLASNFNCRSVLCLSPESAGIGCK
jgi:hypothetical protein